MIECPRCYGKGKVNFGNVSGRICFLCKGIGDIVENTATHRYFFKFANFPDLPVHCATVDAKSEKQAFDKARKDLVKRKSAKGYIENGLDVTIEPIIIIDII